MQIFANALERVFRGNTVGAFGQNVLATLYRFDAHGLAVVSGGKLHRRGNGLAVYYGKVDYVSAKILLPLIGQSGLRTGQADVRVNQPSCS